MSREEVAEAAWRVIVRDGLPRTSVRAIARELNATTGVVTYYFREKAELMLFALDRLCAVILRDLDQAVAGRTDVDRIRAILETTLPIGPKEATGWRIWIAFVGVASSNKRLREEHQRRLEILSRRLGEEVAALQASGKAAKTLDPKSEADALIAFSDGIGLSWVLRPKSYPPDRQRELIDWYLAARFGTDAGKGRARRDGGRGTRDGGAGG
jgi:AcrR family transcriptional regulator